MAAGPPLRLGTRGSQLALWQANHVRAALDRHQVACEVVILRTAGDQDQDKPLADLGGDGLFTSRLQQALLAEEIDFAVHSLKDLPTTPVPGLHLAATPMREEVSDVWISRDGKALAQQPKGVTIGTGSLRRQAQLLRLRPDASFVSLRGNVDTRLAKLAAGEADGIVLAKAGLLRLGLLAKVTAELPTRLMLPAVGQAALGLECRSEDARTTAALRRLNDASTLAAVTAERTMLREISAGCMAPVGALAERTGQRLRLTARVLSPDGRELIEATDIWRSSPSGCAGTSRRVQAARSRREGHHRSLPLADVC